MSWLEAPLGARVEPGGVRFTAWSDAAQSLSVVLYDSEQRIERELPLERAESGYFFATWVPGAAAGTRYHFRVDGQLAVDPYARALPSGVHGPAEVCAPLPARSTPGRHIDLDANAVFYELHVGTFTTEGTFRSAIERLPELRALGATVVELMPIAAFAGTRGWGYDGVGWFAPFAPYGSPNDLRRLIDAVHEQGMSIVLDVVYNHFGPDGNPLPAFSSSYFDPAGHGAWGQKPALNQPAFRGLVLSNARYWLQELGFDGLRLDATHELEPGGTPHILRELSDVAHGCEPRAVLIAEDSRNDPATLLGHGIDAVWSDDFHHVMHVLLTHERDGYYQAYTGDLHEVARVIQRGQLFEGEGDPTRARGRATTGVPLSRFLFALQNHDQVGNRARGERLHDLSDFPAYRAASLLQLFVPATPLLFMGQEWAATTPFLFFSDHHGELGTRVSQGRRQEFQHFLAFRDAPPEAVPDPQDQATFERSKLSWVERERPEHHATLELYRRALELRRTDPVLSVTGELNAGIIDGVLWVLRRAAAGERLLLFNPGAEPRSLPEVGGRSALDATLLLSTHPSQLSPHTFEAPPASASLYQLDGRARQRTE